jgi:hypothetical protein
MSNPHSNQGQAPAPPCDELVLAAVERAGRHRAIDAPPVPVWTILEHLDVARRSADARRVRAQLDVMSDGGWLRCTCRHGVPTWQLSEQGRHRLRRALRAEAVLALPEAPQHRAWRNARTSAGQELGRFRTDLLEQIGTTAALLDADPRPRADAWLEMAETLWRTCRLVGSASHCLYEWPEPDDARPDVDDGIDPGDEGLARQALEHLRALRAGRRNIALWGHSHGD